MRNAYAKKAFELRYAGVGSCACASCAGGIWSLPYYQLIL